MSDSDKMTDHKIEFGADFQRWLTAKIILTTLVLSAIGYYLYHKVSTARAQEAEQAHLREVGIEGTPELIGFTPDWLLKKDGDPGLKLTELMIKGLDLTTAAVVDARIRPLPPQIGTLNYDNETMFLIKCRFNGELVWMAERDDKIIDKDGYEKNIKRAVKFGDKVKQGEVLAVFWSVALGTAKAAFVDAISAVRLSEDSLDRLTALYKDGALPLAVFKTAERQLQGDNNNLLTAERSLRMWKMTDKEIEDLRREANEIIDSRFLDPKGKITKIDDTSVTLLLSKDDKEGTVYKFAKDCKFSRAIRKDGKDDKEEIKGGLKADIFQTIGKKGLGATVVTNGKGEVTDVLVSQHKERDVVDEVNRWARTEVYVPWFDKAHPDRELTVVEKNTNIGDIVDNTNFGTWLFRVADMSKLQVWVHPPEEYLSLIRNGMRKNGGLMWDIRMQADPDAPPYNLHVDLIAPSIEPNQHNPMVVGYLPNKDLKYPKDHKHLVGQFVTATIQMPPEDDTVEIPTVAVNEYNGQSFIFVKAKDRPGEYTIRRIAIVRRYADYTVVRTKFREQDKKFSADEVKEGRYPLRILDRGEQVVTHGVVELTTSLETLLAKESIKAQK